MEINTKPKFPLSQNPNTMKVAFWQWLHWYFPDSYVCAIGESGCVKEGKSSEWLDIEAEMEKYLRINANGAGIFFTPNAIHNAKERHKLTNLNYINAWYIDLDIEASKSGNLGTISATREQAKAEIRGHILCAPLLPSFTVENRNGFHLYWMSGSNCSEEAFKTIERGIVAHFGKSGADRSSTKVVTLLRMPGTFNHKNGEEFPVQIDPSLSHTYEDHSPITYKEEEMLLAFPAPPEEANQAEQLYRAYTPPKTFKRVVNPDGDELFEKIHAMPVELVLERFSGDSFVNGEVFAFRPVFGGMKLNLMINNQPTSNFIDRNSNHIYGKRETTHNGPTITQWLRYYGHDYAEIADQYKLLFKL